MTGLQPKADLRVQPLVEREVGKVPAGLGATAQNALQVQGVVERVAGHR